MATYQTALEALADPTRQRILERLRAGEHAVGELARQLPVSRPAVSQHLKVLKRAGLVRERQVGTRRVYGVELRGLTELRRYLDGFWTDVLAAFKEEAERPAPGPSAPVAPPAPPPSRMPEPAPAAPPRFRRYEPRPFNVEED